LEEEFEDAKGAIRIHQLISYFSPLLFIQSIYKMEKKRQQNFATGNAIYVLLRNVLHLAQF
jgi:acyl-ACP thioesterase